MGGHTQKRKKRKTNTVVDQYLRPTEAREAHNDFRSAGMAFRVIPVIETLFNAQKLSQAEYDALSHYREQAHKAEDDVAQSSSLDPQKVMGGGCSSPTGGTIPSVLLATPAILETARLEKDLGQLRDIARAVAVDDISLTQWCIAKHGGRERYEGTKVVAIVPRDPKGVEIALFELRFAAGYLRP